jgi:dephospho-CoA kinase
MLKVGLTGNYCSGVDKVVLILRKMGMLVFDADLIIKFLLYNNSEVITKIKTRFGKIVFTDNQVDISSFRTPEQFNNLIKLIEPDILKAYEKFRLVNRDSKFIFFKSQILFETGLSTYMNFNISVFKPNGSRVEEIQSINKLRTTEAWKIVDSEMDSFQKNRMCQYTIHNYDAHQDSLERQIASILKALNNKSIEEKNHSY